MAPTTESREVSSLALCWRLERSDGVGIALTSHDRPFEYHGIAHVPLPAILPAAVTRSLGLDANSAEVTGALSSAALGAGDLVLGRWDGARAELTVVDWSNTDSSETRLLGGELGNIELRDGEYSAELRGVASKLERPVCPSTSEHCRAEFGDKSCRVDLAGRTVIALVVQIDGDRLTLDQSIDETANAGRLRYLTGSNTGVATTVIGAEGHTVRVRDLPRARVEPGCKIEIREGCDKAFSTCVERFANAANFRGEPHLPGMDHLTRYPGI